MTNAEMQKIFREQHRLRIEPHMADYIAAKMKADALQDIAVIGGDARTGIPRRQTFAAGTLTALK